MASPDLVELTDTELIGACLDKNMHAWEMLVERYQRLIYSIPLRYGLTENDAADIFQNTCLLMLENLSRLRNRERLGAWLVITTRRECWRLMRRQKVTVAPIDIQSVEDHPNAEPHPEEDLLTLERQSIVYAAIDQLGDRCRKLLTLLFYTDPRPSYEEIVKQTGLPEGSIGPTRARCLQKLLDILNDSGFFN